jgi:hypothetical protein
MGALMYGYAIEAHVKCSWALFNNSGDKAVNSHNLRQLFEITERDGHFSDIETPYDLLDFSYDHFRRYPKNTYDNAKRAKEAGRCLALTPNVGRYLEKFIILLDESITRSYGDGKVSILRKAAHDLESQRGKDFFCNNIPALKRLDLIVNLLEDEISTIETQGECLSNYETHIRSTRNTIALIQQLKLDNHALINGPCVDLDSFSNPGIPDSWHKAPAQ